MTHPKLLPFSIAFLALIIGHTSAYSQNDSLVDCFPLSIGNRWLYQFDHWLGDEADPGGHNITDTGTALYTILRKADYPDSIVWTFSENRIFHRLEIYVIGHDTVVDSTIVDSTLFNLVERRAGRHELYQQLREPHSDLLSGVMWNNVMPFQADLPDTARMYRYHKMDSTNTASLRIEYPTLEIEMGITAKRDSGLVFLSVRWVCTLCFDVAHHQLLSRIILEVPGDRMEDLPQEMSLGQNYPNPFNPSTSISFSIPKHTHVRLQIFNLLGELIETLADEDKQPGNYSLTWDASTKPSGLYFYRMTAGEFVRTKKAVLLR